MTQVIEPFEKSDLKQESVRRWVSQAFTGILSGFDVSAGASGFQINLSSGECWINREHIDDDESRLNLVLITTGAPAGADEHWIIYGSHTPAAQSPAPPMTISAIMSTPPAVPTLPANSVKFADVFVPSGANDIGDCTIIRAPKLPDRGSNDGDQIIERLVNSNMNILFSGGGSVTYNGTDTLGWTADMELVATTITNKEKFASVPLTASRVEQGSLGPNPFGGGTDHGSVIVGPNSILFAVLDRLSPQDPNSPVITGLRALNLDTPDPTEANAFYDPVREKIVFIGALFSGVFKARSGIGSPLPPPIANVDAFLRNEPGGAHYWSVVTEDIIVSILAITSLAATPNIVELGDNVGNGGAEFAVLSFSAGYAQGPPTTTSLTNDENGSVEDPLGQDPGVGGTFVYNGVTLQEITPGANGQVVFSLAADAGDTPDSQDETVDWWRYTYWGDEVAASPTLDNTFLKTTLQSQGSKSLRSNRNVGINFTIGGSDAYVYFAYPAWKGAVSSVIDNNTAFDVTSAFTLVGTSSEPITTENAAVIGESYNIYRSTNLQGAGSNINITVN